LSTIPAYHFDAQEQELLRIVRQTLNPLISYQPDPLCVKFIEFWCSTGNREIDAAFTAMLMSILNALLTLYLAVGRLSSNSQSRFNDAFRALLNGRDLHDTWHVRMNLPELYCNTACCYMLTKCVNAVRVFFDNAVKHRVDNGHSIWPAPPQIKPGDPLGEIDGVARWESDTEPDPEPILVPRPRNYFEDKTCKETVHGPVKILDSRLPRDKPAFIEDPANPHCVSQMDWYSFVMRVLGAKLSKYRTAEHFWEKMKYKTFLLQLIYQRDKDTASNERPEINAYFSALDQGGLTIPRNTLNLYGARVAEQTHRRLSMDLVKCKGKETFTVIRSQIDGDARTQELWANVRDLAAQSSFARSVSKTVLERSLEHFRMSITQALCNTLFKVFLDSWPTQRAHNPQMALRVSLKAGGCGPGKSARKNTTDETVSTGAAVEPGFWSRQWCKCNNINYKGEYYCRHTCWEDYMKDHGGKSYRPSWCVCIKPRSPYACYGTCWDDFVGEITETENAKKTTKKESASSHQVDVPVLPMDPDDDADDRVHPEMGMDHSAALIGFRQEYAARLAPLRGDVTDDDYDEDDDERRGPAFRPTGRVPASDHDEDERCRVKKKGRVAAPGPEVMDFSDWSDEEDPFALLAVKPKMSAPP
jgi:hypothetical protein